MGAHIVVVDDNAATLKLTRLFLRAAGYGVEVFNDPQQALTALSAQQPELVLVEANSPGLDLAGFVASLRSTSGGLRVAFFSTLPEEQLHELVAQHRVAGYIRKGSPLNARNVVRQVRRLLTEREVGQWRRALVVDDSRTMRKVVGRILKGLEFEVLEAPNGREALGVLAENPQVDLVLVDLHMPELDGFGFVQEMRREEAYDFVRVLMVTSETEMSYVSRAMEAGADGFVNKPFTREMIVNKLGLLGMSPRS